MSSPTSWSSEPEPGEPEEESRFHVSLSELDKARYIPPVDRAAEEQELPPPGTATVYVADHLKPRPDPMTIEGMLGAYGSMAETAAGDGPGAGRARLMTSFLLWGVLSGVVVSAAVTIWQLLEG